MIYKKNVHQPLLFEECGVRHWVQQSDNQLSVEATK